MPEKPKVDEFWMIPNNIKDRLAELIGTFCAEHPSVTPEDISELLKAFDTLVHDYMDEDEKAN